MENQVKEEETEILLNDLLEVHGYDFSDYSRASLNRRINRLYQLDAFPSFAEFRYRILHDVNYLTRVVEEITVNVTEMFRDPSFYKCLRNEILPILATYPLLRIWMAGCSTGEEVYSMAILLEEAGLLHKSLLYATDINPSVLEQAAGGVFPLAQMKQYAGNYIEAGGRLELSAYYTAAYNKAKFNDTLRQRMIFSTHNLVSDHSFNEFQLVLCRNVLIYFNKQLQNKVFTLFDESLESLGFLALGSKETLRFAPVAKKFQQWPGKEKIWRKSSI